MKKYIKPIIDLSKITPDTKIAQVGLSGWLDDNQVNDYENSITTCEFSS